MHWIDWAVMAVYLVWMIWDGLRMTKRSHELEGYFLGARSLPWWAVGLSVMATQLSAITMIGTTGQGYADGMRFLQFYYALPLAMVVLSVTLVPFFHRARIYTAYEYLEQRFDAKTRALTSFLFLVSRSMSLGVVISAPAVVLAVVLDFDVTTTALLIALPTAVYTMFGGVQAVTWTVVMPMVLCVAGGTGLAPILSILRGAIAQGMPNPIHLYFGVRSQRDVYGLDWLTALERKHPALKLHVVVTSGGDPREQRCGLVTEAIAQDLGSLDGWRAYLCGSPPMVEAATVLARQKGIAPARIYADAFYTQPT